MRHRARYEQRLYVELILAGGELDVTPVGYKVTLPSGKKLYYRSRRVALIAARDTMLRDRTHHPRQDVLVEPCRPPAWEAAWGRAMRTQLEKLEEYAMLYGTGVGSNKGRLWT